ncbi:MULTISPECIES: permease-like cell division protein FtsX [unclassified Nocardioides]|uniref:permease-like cell division protein FtsX n=1 Tax=unclassified Nocardioides TaxID=2615069 RepID=UPI0006F4771A|nr:MULTISPECIES: permease-like cell division protein FtsX [unclassified Nocardioides]KQY63522.1 cell division protein FtsX [Nocardioides sp. Root140]KQZ67421.1 cell division protein FtsX [Nocardioides sp. Root151]KRF17527.1 cell division protein FtsX [Nocardioides sp. Soil796]
MQLRHVFSELVQGLRRNLTMHIAVVLTLFVSLTLVGMGFLLNAEADKAEQRFGDLNQIIVSLCNENSRTPQCSGEVTEAQQDAILKVIDENPEVSGYHVESQDEAYKKSLDLYSESDQQTSLIKKIGPQALRSSVWIDLKDRDKYKGIASAVEGLDGVYGVRDNRDIVEPVFKTLDTFKFGSYAIAGFLIFAALLLVANTIRLAAFARRREIGIMRLVGASSLYISLPFLLEALVTALFGVVLAGGALAAFMQFGVKEQLSDQIQFLPWIGWPEYLQSLGWVAIIGPLLTVIPTLLLTRKYLKV